jgi:protein SCO1/2
MKTFELSSAILLLAVSVMAESGSCSTNTTPSCCAKVEPAGTFSERSLYQTESKWTTDTNKQLKLGDLKGRPQVIVMFFASCQYACPVLVHDLTRIEAALNPELRGKVGFTLVTFDTKRDTPEALAKFRATRNLSPTNWTLLHGSDDDVLELAALLGVKYKQEASGQFAHSNIITVLNAEGEIVHQLTGLGQDVSETVRELENLLKTKE